MNDTFNLGWQNKQMTFEEDSKLLKSFVGMPELDDLVAIKLYSKQFEIIGKVDQVGSK